MGTNRRGFLAQTVALTTIGGRSILADDPVAAARAAPRATAGDPVEPEWSERLTVTVGPSKAEIVGTTEKAIQAAVEYAVRFGGGTVQLLPGEYRLRNAVHLQSGVRLIGAGAETVLVKEPSVTTKLAADSDWYDQEITLADASGFRVGDGVCLRTKNPHNGGLDVAKRTLVARDGNRFKLDRALRQNFWQMGDTTVATLFPLLAGEEIANVRIEKLALDGNKTNNDNLDGNHAGCLFMQDCRHIQVYAVEARNYNGDGLSWQICHDVEVTDCHCHDNAGLGLHPGSGSQRPVMRNNRLDMNQIGIFFCWGVKHGVAEGNRITFSREAGISVGHRDTHNLIWNNTIISSGRVGILFRAERGKDFAPHRNRVNGNLVIDSGGKDGIGVDIQGQTEGIELSRNVIREDRASESRVGVRIGAETRDIRLEENQIKGFSVAVPDLRAQ